MHHFFQTAIKLLQKYKSLLRKQLSLAEYRQKLLELQLDKRLPQDEVVLYHLLEQIVSRAQAENPTMQSPAVGLRYSGSSQSIQDMRELLAHYHIEGRNVIHTVQVASRAMVEAIQLMVLPEVKRDQQVAIRLDSCSLKIAQYGMKEQHLSFWNSLKTKVNQDGAFFSPLLDQYEEYLERHTAEDQQVVKRSLLF